MQVQQIPIYQFLEGMDKSFVIPVYQRDYAWTINNCQKLWEDLINLTNNQRPDHFLGTIVTIGSGYQEYTVIDGQQRLTTISIFLIALHQSLKNKVDISPDENTLLSQILDFLVNKYSSEKDKRIRLKPNKQDKFHFENLIETGDLKNISSNIANNFKFFLEKISKSELSPRQIFDSFRKLKIVLIDLIRGQDDPQLIFESLNSTGVDLTAGDLIRNYILMDLKPTEQEKYYNTYWIKIEKLVGNIAEFVRNYLIHKIKLTVKEDEVYKIFKKYSEETFQKNKENILKDLIYFAEIYSWLIQFNKHSNNKINEKLNRLNKIKFSVSHPYYLEVFDDLNKLFLSEEDVIKILTIIESYAFRKMIVDNSTQGLNKMFITLSREIKKESHWKEKYVEILNYILLEKRVSQRFPTDEELENALINKEVYKLQAKNRNFLLESLENFKSAYPINLEELTIEHIMPQKLNKDWKKKLGENWQELHNKYLHTLGNLSLTAKNSELSNYSFEEKQQIDYQTSKLKLNFNIDGLKIWNENTIVSRAKGLIKSATNIWPYPKTTYSKEIKDELIFDLTSEDSFTNSKPLFLYIEEDEIGIELKTWRDLLKNTCSHLYNFSPTQFNEVYNSMEFRMNFDSSRPLRNPISFAENMYVEGNLSANGIISLLSKLCERIKYPPENISFSIKEGKEG